MIRPTYSERFRCIGPACEDSCCVGWAVPVDKAAYEKYQTVPAGPLRVLLDENIVPIEESATESPTPGHFARIKMPPSLDCPMLTEERLCRIHAELGEEFLCRTCDLFPRIAYTIDSVEERSLALACPEAARLILLDPDLMRANVGGGYEQMAWDESPEASRLPLRFFWPIREFTVGLIGNRAYPLWQRMFLLGSFCRRVDAAVRGETDRGVAGVLRDFPGAIAKGGLGPAMDGIPADLALQLDMVLQLAGICRDRALVGPRFLECVEAFKTGIGAIPTATMRNLIDNYADAYTRFYAPFFAAHPHILENYLLNAVFRRQFPFGLKDGMIAPMPEMAREFALLATQFALIKGLLIGVAGCHKENFLCRARDSHGAINIEAFRSSSAVPRKDSRTACPDGTG